MRWEVFNEFPFLVPLVVGRREVHRPQKHGFHEVVRLGVRVFGDVLEALRLRDAWLCRHTLRPRPSGRVAVVERDVDVLAASRSNDVDIVISSGPRSDILHTPLLLCT